MGKCSEATPVELTQAYVFNIKHCSPEEPAEMGKCAGKTSAELTQADLCNLTHCYPEDPAASIGDDLFKPKPRYPKESVVQLLAAGSSKLPPQ
jgi:hypothetical protein